MNPDTTLTLGDFAFASFEVPEQIPFGGTQRLTVHELVGGVRVIDAMGAAPLPIEWSGHFVGTTARDRAKALDDLRKAGQPLVLAWDELSFHVVIKSFECEFERFYRMRYHICCEVVDDRVDPVVSSIDPGIDQLVAEDLSTATDLVKKVTDVAAQINDSKLVMSIKQNLTTAMNKLQSAIDTVDSLATAAQSTINNVRQSITEVRAQTSLLLKAANDILQTATTLGGILPNNPVSNQAKALVGQIEAVNQSAAFVELDGTLGRIQSNIDTVNSGLKSNVNTITSGLKVVPEVGGNLYAIAAKEYGDAMGWVAIAKANLLTDPQIKVDPPTAADPQKIKAVQLIIPPNNVKTGGVLNA